tara:strand:+ start:23085 stop:23966 length:882 start_codon:yes stop_codon:yes gene_type:complete
MRNAMYSVHKLYKRENNLSFNTRADYERLTKTFIKTLHSGGYPISDIRHLKPKSISFLINAWQQDGLGPGALRNRMSVLRHVCREIGKESFVEKNNKSYRLPKREYTPKSSKAIFSLPINHIRDQCLQLSISLQQEFGLRREECLKFIPSYAIKDGYIELKASWTKGGISRKIPITTESQKALLQNLQSLIPRGSSLIPDGVSYFKHLNTYKQTIRSLGFKSLHGLRHAYAQKRYATLVLELTGDSGWCCPFQGGPKRSQMSKQQRLVDYHARKLVSLELGHSRVGITTIYLG